MRDQIYFDYKRWKVGDKYIGGNMYGMKITGDMENPSFLEVPLRDARMVVEVVSVPALSGRMCLTTNGVLAQNPGLEVINF